MWGKLEKINDEDFINIVKESFYIKDIIIKCGYFPSSVNSTKVRKKVKLRSWQASYSLLKG